MHWAVKSGYEKAVAVANGTYTPSFLLHWFVQGEWLAGHEFSLAAAPQSRRRIVSGSYQGP